MKKEEQSVLVLEPLEPEALRRFKIAARASGLHDDVCVRCTRPFLTRSYSSLCPPCRGEAAGDGWTPAHTFRSLLTGDPRADAELLPCPECEGLGAPGWAPFRPAVRCGTCNGTGQIE